MWTRGEGEKEPRKTSPERSPRERSPERGPVKGARRGKQEDKG